MLDSLPTGSCFMKMRKGSSPPSNEGDCWSTIPTELLHVILSYGDLETIKVARLVCKGWRPAQARLEPCVPIRLCPLDEAAHPAALHASASADCPAGPETPAHDDQQTVATASRARETAWPQGHAASPAVGLLGWLSSTFGGQLEQEGTVVLTVQEGRSGLQSQRSIRGASSRTAAAHGSGARTPKAGGDDGTAIGNGATVGDRSVGHGTSLSSVLHHLAATGQQHLRIQHAAASAAAGVLSPYSCGITQAGIWRHLDRTPRGRGLGETALQPYHPCSCGTGTSTASSSSSSPLPSSGGCDCWGATALPPPQRHLPAPGLSALTALHGLRSLELYGISFRPALLASLTSLAQLTRLCVDLPLPVNAAAACLPRLTTLQCLHFTVTWPAKTVAAAVATGAGAGAASLPPARQHQQHQASLRNSTESTPSSAARTRSRSDNSNSSSPSSSQLDHELELLLSSPNANCDHKEGDDDDDESGLSDEGDDFYLHNLPSSGASALTLEQVLPTLAALTALPSLTDLRLSVCCESMARSLLAPPELLAAARRACPRLCRFGFRVLSEWQLAPKTLYNWLAADSAGHHALSPIRDDSAGPDKQVFIWQRLEWCSCCQPESQGANGSHEGYFEGGAATLSSPSAAVATPTSCRPQQLSAAHGGAAALCSAAEAEAGAGAVGGDVSLGLRVSGSSWLGSCLDAAGALDAAAGGLPGARVGCLVLEDPCLDWGAGEGLSLRSLDALTALRELQLRDLGREPPHVRQGQGRQRHVRQEEEEGPGRRGGAQEGPTDDPGDHISQLLRLPSLTSLTLHTTCPQWLEVLLPPPLPPPHPAPQEADPQGRPQPSAAAPSATPQRLQHLRLHLRGRAGRPNLPLLYRAGAAGSDEDEDEEEKEDVLGGPGVGFAGPGGPPVLQRLAALTALRSLELNMPTVLWLSWLPPSLRHLSLTGVTLLLLPLLPDGPSDGPNKATTTHDAVSAAGGRNSGGVRFKRCRKERPRSALLGSDLSNSDPSPEEDGEVPEDAHVREQVPSHEGKKAGPSSAVMKTDAAAAAAAGPSTAVAAAAPPPLLPHLVSLSAENCVLPPLSSLLAAAGCRTALTSLTLAGCRTPLPPGTTPRAAQLLLAAELAALTSACGRSLRVLRVTQPSGLLDVSGGREGGGGGAAAARVLSQALQRLPRLQSLCWEVGAEQQERLLAGLGPLRELRQLFLCAHVGPAGLQHLRRLTGLRCLLQLCPSRQARGAQAWMRQLEPHLPLCLCKCVPLDWGS